MQTTQAGAPRRREDRRRRFRCVKTGTNHYSLAFTYDSIAWSRDGWGEGAVLCWRPGDPHHHDPIMDMRG